MSKFKLSLVLLALALAASVDCHAAGRGRTMSVFKASYVRPETNRILLKLDVEAAMEGLPTDVTRSRNNDLAGLDITVNLNGVEFTETFASNGRINTATFKARLVANGRILMLDLRGLDLETILGLDSSVTDRKLSTGLDVTVNVSTPVDSETGEIPPDGIDAGLYDGHYDYTYWSKADRGAVGHGYPSN
ncbi:MAG: hypothetical protein M5U26_01350 [Planctomycetota bacterium]|nr:hypothetical protein [Planctomycetota bacterium]